MSEYIEREAAYPLAKKICDAFHSGEHSVIEMPFLILDWIDDIPAADVRPVVTCADCKYNTREVNDLFGNNAIQCITGLTHRRDWFCADGKKREES